MTIAIASGKGGTGKTMLSASLVHLLSMSRNVTLLDLDVEEPNAHLFFTLPVHSEEAVWRMVPEVNMEHCSLCGRCQQVCAFNALVCLEDDILIFPELCKGCRGCVALCPDGAMLDGKKMIGMVEVREEGTLRTVTGRLRIGETAVPELIREVKKHVRPEDDLVVMDAPPGTACAAVEAVRGADYSILVAESTPFGLHDLDLMVQTMRLLEQPFGVVINKAVSHDTSVHEYCAKEQIDILGVIPADADIARACASGAIVAEAEPDTVRHFDGILSALPLGKEVTV